MSTNQTESDKDAQDIKDIGTQEEWGDLSTEEQDQILEERLEDTGVSSQPLPEEDQLSAIQRLEGKLEETWQAVLFGDTAVECYQLSEAQMDEVFDWAELVFQVSDQDGEDPEELDPALLDDLEEMEEWLPSFLADLTVEDEMDEGYWDSGERFPKGTRLELFMEVFEKHQEDIEDVGNGQ